MQVRALACDDCPCALPAMLACSYLTNSFLVDSTTSFAVPRGWPDEHHAIYRAGKVVAWEEKRHTLFWRGGETNPARRTYSSALAERALPFPPSLAVDVKLCGSHCRPEEGVRPEDWCKHKFLLSMPGASFAVGFKYTLLCSSLVVRGAFRIEKESRDYQQWWQAPCTFAH